MAARTLTSQQDKIALAKQFARERGYEGRTGGWVYNAAGAPVAQGWAAFADRLVAKGWIVLGKGIDWPKSEGLVLTRTGFRKAKWYLDQA